VRAVMTYLVELFTRDAALLDGSSIRATATSAATSRR
jgi:hypothetical protein